MYMYIYIYMSFEKDVVLSNLIGCVRPITMPLVILACRQPWHHMLLRKEKGMQDGCSSAYGHQGQSCRNTRQKNASVNIGAIPMLYSYMLITKGMFGEVYSACARGKPNTILPLKKAGN